MCDEFTRAAEDAALLRQGLPLDALSRRGFGVLGAGAALAGCAGTGAGAAGGGDDVIERSVEITTPDGIADAFFVHPDGGAHPGIVMWPDVAGLREAKKVMARRLAAAGYAVLCVNPYYRGGPPPLESFAQYRTPEGEARIKPLRDALTPAAVTSDAKAYVAFLDSDKAVDRKRRIGSNGYCMGGPFTVRTAAAVPGRVGAAASFHGGGLVTDAPDSPHRLLATTKAGYLFAIARNDDARDPAGKDTLRKAADAAKVSAEIEVYAADHGWCVPDSPTYDPNEADRAWQRMLALYSTL